MADAFADALADYLTLAGTRGKGEAEHGYDDDNSGGGDRGSDGYTATEGPAPLSADKQAALSVDATENAADACWWTSYRDEDGRMHTTTADGRYTLDVDTGYWYDWQTNDWLWYDAATGQYHSAAAVQMASAHADAPAGNETIRLVVLASSVLAPNAVAVVDASGVTLARDRGPGRRLRLAELAVSKFHAQLYYEADTAGRVLATTISTPDHAPAHRETDDHTSEEGEVAPATAMTPQHVSLAHCKASSGHSHHRHRRHHGSDHEDTHEMAIALPSTVAVGDAGDSGQGYRCPYWIVDCGSMHGTFVNGVRLSEARVSSQPQRLHHGDRVRVGNTEFEVHAHDEQRGWGSCARCTLRDDNTLPILWEEARATMATSSGGARTSASRDTSRTELGDRRVLAERARRDELRRMKRKYAQESDASMHHGKRTGSYVDRAAQRRARYPDATPFTQDEQEEMFHQQQQQQQQQRRRLATSARAASALATMAPAIDASNKGHRMLQRMGWSVAPSQPSGVSNGCASRPGISDGLAAPVAVGLMARPERLGLGAGGGETQLAAAAHEEAQRAMETPGATARRLARERYAQLAE
ncbi:hypothetical protein THASP1DRAFT_32080 [Thamnocephalis sphaerospora]|uniref:G-patch domain-containing protein n=1 Tax=Thamnocephalis sphaerospora TaxID=78915 RepID=A0A4P9XJY0_9FUNG|nr:hypothetical protein THASP1DRAFT_32080 [Thamnocephalis sphaerospora]|eukprot:RKP06097.1 hypothetical protein THASP1DRAFT_32080 [Thamnocephalis sphaerospora]